MEQKVDPFNFKENIKYMNKLKIFLFTTIAIFFTCSVWGAAPELRNVMPNSWFKLDRLSPAEEIQFMRNNTRLLKKIISVASGSFYYEPDFQLSANINVFTSIYRETIGTDTFYRLVTGEEKNQNYDGEKKKFIQSLIYDRNGESILLGIGAYNEMSVRQDGTDLNCTSFEIVSENNKAKGFIISVVEQKFDDTELRRRIYVKNQAVGRTSAMYYFMKDIATVNLESDYIGYIAIPYFLNLPYVYISVSDCLIDTRSPLKYGIQSAFDGNPSTSYVENTKNDLIEFQLNLGQRYPEKAIQKLSIINGYAANNDLYYENNRVKEIAVEQVRVSEYGPTKPGEKYQLLDGTLIPQVLDYSSHGYIFVTDIYPGTNYNDTCIAEINILTAGGWLFGD
jgi:hypothetical protein